MKETSNFTRLQEVVMSNSENSNNWNDAKNEWRVKSCFVKENENCSCGHDIKNVFIIKNKKNKNTLQIGSSCILHFDDDYMDLSAKSMLKRLKTLERANKKAFIDSENERFKKHLVNIVEKSFVKHYINEWEYKFYLQLKSHKKFTEKQTVTLKKIKTKLNRFFVNNPEDFDVKQVKEMIANNKEK